MNPIGATQESTLIGFLIITFGPFGIWTLFWKGIALWKASKSGQRNWFIAFLAVMTFVNTVGILELIYLFKFSKNPLSISEIRSWATGSVSLRKPKK